MKKGKINDLVHEQNLKKIWRALNSMASTNHTDLHETFPAKWQKLNRKSKNKTELKTLLRGAWHVTSHSMRYSRWWYMATWQTSVKCIAWQHELYSRHNHVGGWGQSWKHWKLKSAGQYPGWPENHPDLEWKKFINYKIYKAPLWHLARDGCLLKPGVCVW